MTSAWETFQERIKAEMRKKYSEAVVEHSSNPRNIGGFEDADGHARITGPCDDTMEIWIKVEADTIVKAGFVSNGCGITIASKQAARE